MRTLFLNKGEGIFSFFSEGDLPKEGGAKRKNRIIGQHSRRGQRLNHWVCPAREVGKGIIILRITGLQYTSSKILISVFKCVIK